MDSDKRTEPAKRLRLAREAAGFETALAAVRQFGWTYDSYVQHENGTRGLARSASVYAEAFDVSEGWLLAGSGPGPGEHAEAIRSITEAYLSAPPNFQNELLQHARTIRIATEAVKHKRDGRQDSNK